MPDIQIENVTRKYGEMMALDNVSFVIENAKRTAILGPSGAGKTTLLRIISGLEQPDEGRVLFDENDVTELLPHQRKAAMIFQDGALFSHTRIRANIAWGLSKLGYAKDEIRDMTEETASLLHIENLLDRYPAALSAGERQRAGIARALVRKPQILLMDEPFANLDIRLREELQELVTNIQQMTQMTMILVTHDQNEAMNMADRIALLQNGSLTACDTPASLYDHPANLITASFIGSPQMNIYEPGTDMNQRLLSLYEIDDKSLTIGIRPDDVYAKEGGNDGTVEALSTQGGRSYLRVLTPLGTVSATCETPLKRGTAVSLSFRRDRLHLFDENGNAVKQ